MIMTVQNLYDFAFFMWALLCAHIVAESFKRGF